MKVKSTLMMAALTVVGITGLCTFGGCTVSEAPAGGGGAQTNAQVNTNSGLITIDGILVTPELEYSLIENKASLAAEAAITLDTNSIPYIEAWDAILSASLADGNYDPVQLRSALNNISVNEIKNSALVKLGIMAVVNDYATLATALNAQGIAGTNALPYLRPALKAIRDGNAAVLADGHQGTQIK